MKTVFKFSLAFAFCVCLSATPSYAQYKGALPGTTEQTEKDRAAKPVPRIFSSQVTSVEQTEYLDTIYDALHTSLWNYAATDMIYQKQLIELLAPDRFQYTRYSQEFSGLLAQSLENLNKNYKAMMANIEAANEEYELVRRRIRASDMDILDPLWAEKKDEITKDAAKYFKLQHEYLKTYRKLVTYILKQGGSYYYDGTTQKVSFYKFGGYQFFGKSIDTLNKINFEQRKHLIQNAAPANPDLTIFD